MSKANYRVRFPVKIQPFRRCKLVDFTGAKMVSLTVASWNQMSSWSRQLAKCNGFSNREHLRNVMMKTDFKS